MLPYLSLQLADDGPMVFLLPLLFYKRGDSIGSFVIKGRKNLE